ncbi:sulfotransferase 1C4 [Caerostris extrusa]|uniref:Sulfotransferase 1C4 n=1 Tax=Caerostris extrusa TaxID=172846 RepID=A0AAV4MYT7_CAEEX|nr:sulfotransferase 1C4 [Caerostris extrusa]
MDKKPRYVKIDGILAPPSFVAEIYKDAMAFKPGRTFIDNGGVLRHFTVSEMTPMEILSELEKPRCIKTHLPFDRISFSKRCQSTSAWQDILRIASSPFFHHTRFFPIYFFSDGCFDDYFELFIKGEVDWNDYFDHLLSWYEHKDEPNILFLTYEAMKSDPRDACLKIARFLGDNYYDLLTENDEAMLKKVLEYSSVEFMKSTVNEFWKEQFSAIPSEELQMLNPVIKKYAKLMEEAEKEGHVPLGGFIRKGVVGDGKITLSKEQLDKLNERINQKTSHSDVMNLWKKS